MYKHLGLGIAASILLACSPPPREEPARSEQANFVNGGFEAGNLGSWTVTRALWGNGNNNPGFVVFPPRTLTDLNLTLNSGTALTTAVGAGVPSELAAADSLRTPFAGTTAAKVNAPIGGQGNHNSNILQQSMTVTVADVDATDGLVHVRFAVAPVLNAPTHNPDEQPYFFVELRNTTKNVALYNTFNFSNQPGVAWKTSAAGTVGNPRLYTDWMAFDIAPGAAGIEVGDVIQATAVGTGCSFNAHFGEVYVDEFGTTFPYPNVSVSAPQLVPANSDLVYTITAKNSGTGSATGVIVDFTTPVMSDSNLGGAPRTVDTTYVSTSSPGVTCTNPAPGATGTVSCNVGSLAPGATYTFTVTVHVPVVPGSHTAPDFINMGTYGIRTDQRPTPLGGGLVQTQVSASSLVGLSTTLTDNTASVIWGAADVYTLTVTNNGPNTATNVAITDVRPGALASPSWTCLGAGAATCGAANGNGALNTSATIPVGGSVVYTINTTVTGGPAASSFTYRATAAPTGGQVQSVAFNNIGTDTDTVSAALFALAVTKDAAGNGNGTVTSFPAGIACGATCSASYASGTQVALTALPAVGSVFTGWTGACTGLGNPCLVTVSAITAVTARFDQPSLVTALATTSNGGLTTVRPGDTADYSVKISIPAGATALPVVVTDVFPTGLGYSTSTTPTTTGALTCSPGACTAPTIVSGATTTLDFGLVTCTIAGPCELNVTIRARVAATTTRGDSLVDSIAATLMGTQLQTALTVIEPNLTISRTSAPATGLVRGSPETVTVTLANNTGGANAPAFDVVVTLPIPANYSGGNYVAGTCPGAVASFSGGNAVFTFPAGNAGAIAAASSCTFTYDLTGGATAAGNATVNLLAGTATSTSVTGAAPPAKSYSAPAAGISFGTAAIANGGGCAAGAECVSVICDADSKCGYADGNGGCSAMTAAVVCRSGQCSQNGKCAPSGGCLVDGDCTAQQFCNTQTSACVPRLANAVAIPTITGHAPALNGTCTMAVGMIVCASGACDPADNLCGYAEGDGPCSNALVCRSGFCSSNGLCGPLGGCLADADCDLATQFCNTQSKACVPKLPNGGAVPSVTGHTPPLVGACSMPVGVVVCQSAVCDTADNLCGYANGDGSCDVSTAPVVCRSATCGSDGLCGLPNGQGPCTPADGALICRSGTCLPTGLCGAGCALDSDCDTATQFCNTELHVCTTKLANGAPIPTVSGHTPDLTGSCSTAVGTSVCSAGVCDPSDNLCGFPDGMGPCTSANGAQVCRSGACSPADVCGAGCSVDSDCDGATEFCNTEAHGCSPKLANGVPIPTVSGHNPGLTGACTPAVAQAVCAAAICDPIDNMCGLANGSGECTQANGGTVCRSGVCAQNGVCNEPGVSFSFTGGGLSCAFGGTGGTSSLWLFGLVLLATAILRRRRGSRTAH